MARAETQEMHRDEATFGPAGTATYRRRENPTLAFWSIFHFLFSSVPGSAAFRNQTLCEQCVICFCPRLRAPSHSTLSQYNSFPLFRAVARPSLSCWPVHLEHPRWWRSEVRSFADNKEGRRAGGEGGAVGYVKSGCSEEGQRRGGRGGKLGFTVFGGVASAQIAWRIWKWGCRKSARWPCHCLNAQNFQRRAAFSRETHHYII